MNGGRGAKGSINDRLISMMYRNRYALDKKKKEGYSKGNAAKQKEYLHSIQTFDVAEDVTSLDEEDKKVVETAFNQEDSFSKPEQVEMPFTPTYQEKVKSLEAQAEAIENNPTPTISSVQDISDKMVEVDLTTEVFDFEHYDYYEVLSQHTGISDYPEEDVIDVEREIEKVEDEETILTELSTFIEESQVIISEIKEDLIEVKDLIPKSQTQEQVSALEEKYVAVKAKVDLLKKQYDVVKEKYNFEDFEILASIEMMSAIEDYHDKASLEELETLVDVCKSEIDQIDGVLIEEKKSLGILEDVQEQKREVVKRDQDFQKNKEGVLYLDDLERKIAKEAGEQAQIIAELEKKLANFTTEIEVVTRTVYHTERMFGSLVRIAAGILTAPFSGRNVFGTMLGTHLINRGIRQLRDSLNPEFVQTPEVRHRYQDIEREILNSKDSVNTTADLIDDSIYQLNQFEKEFNLRFKAFSNIIPQYADVLGKIESLQTSLKHKKEEVKEMQKHLDRQYEENKVKVKRAA